MNAYECLVDFPPGLWVGFLSAEALSSVLWGLAVTFGAVTALFREFALYQCLEVASPL